MFKNIYFSKSQVEIYIYHLYLKLIGVALPKNVDHERKLILVHNPKVAGTTMKQIFGFNLKDGETTSHKTPTFLVGKKIWENYTSIIAVRHPVTRLISSYNYHVNSNYNGYFLKKYPSLLDFTFEKYFDVFSKLPFVISPQCDYINHQLSSKKADYIIKYEDFENGLIDVLNDLNIEIVHIPHLNRSIRENINYFDNEEFKKKVNDFYLKDYLEFNYDPI
ncbi:MAG: sulfotransferase family 2 domain-containing protein [Bacteroidota bacterium]